MGEKNNCIQIPREPSPLDPIIDNGSLVQMGINVLGDLNVPGGTPSFEDGTTFVGLRYILTNGESTAPGCLCEGWGVANADAATVQFTAYANESVGTANLVMQPGTGVTNSTGQIKPESVGSAFRSVVRDVTDRVEVIQDYKPSTITPNLYQVDVTITNIGSTPIGDLRYRRVMDWDIPPTTFNEFVEIHVGTSANLVVATTDGFQSANPLSSPGPNVGAPPTTLVSGSPDYFGGPADQGALFDFTFGALAPGGVRKFTIFYGAGANRQEVFNAIAAVGAEMYTFGFPTDLATNTAAINGPNAFVFAFKGVGGTPITRGLSFSV